jgi:hypothetical protein
MTFWTMPMAMMHKTGKRGFDPDTPLGTFIDGGYFIGTITDGGVGYALILASKAEGRTSTSWGPTNTNENADSMTDGPANTVNLVAASGSHPAASFCAGLTIGGFNDWYLPAIDEWGVIYANRSALTGDEAFGTGINDTYWASTEYSVFNAWILRFNNGLQYNQNKTSSTYALAARRVALAT